MNSTEKFKKSVSVIVPVFNEAANIIANLDLLITEIEDHFESYDILVVSDGSTDGTNSALASFHHPGVRFKILEQNQGKGSAIKKGFQEARGEYIFFIDGGMELHPKELKIFLGLMNLYDADIIVGSKRHPQSQVHYPWYRRLLSWVFQIIIRFLFHLNIKDTQVGIKLFKRKVINSVLPHMQIARYGFDLEILSLAVLFGHNKILEAPIRLDYFLNHRRFIAFDLLHVFKVGYSLLKDTLSLYFRLQKIKSAHSPSVSDGK